MCVPWGLQAANIAEELVRPGGRRTLDLTLEASNGSLFDKAGQEAQGVQLPPGFVEPQQVATEEVSADGRFVTHSCL